MSGCPVRKYTGQEYHPRGSPQDRQNQGSTGRQPRFGVVAGCLWSAWVTSVQPFGSRGHQNILANRWSTCPQMTASARDRLYIMSPRPNRSRREGGANRSFLLLYMVLFLVQVCPCCEFQHFICLNVFYPYKFV